MLFDCADFDGGCGGDRGKSCVKIQHTIAITQSYLNLQKRYSDFLKILEIAFEIDDFIRGAATFNEQR